jgi:pilus assembly protein Flp/PilA
MKRLSTFARSFLNDESGATAIEYSMIALFVAVGIIAVLDLIGVQLVGLLTAAAAGFA